MFLLKRISTFVLDCLPAAWRDYLFSIKRFGTKQRIFPQQETIIFFTEKGKWHGGLCDRFKGIISLFHFCLCNEIVFKINHTFPFDLSDFLLPNEYNWLIGSEEISFHRQEAQLLNIIGDASIDRLVNLKSKKQIHAFANRDVVSILNAKYDTNFTWGEIFKKLFRPCHELQEDIDRHIKIIGTKYVCAVLRFQNLLGDFEEYGFKPLHSYNEKKSLIKKCKQAIIELQQKENCKILTTSDSQTFLRELNDIKNVYAFPSKIVHIDSVEGEKKNVYMKSFLDFYLLSESEKIFSIGSDIMYDSDFPRYAAKVNNIPFERILI